ncbi:uncharacterized protein LOC129119636 [Agelaius phoeniceus]|uniref:uncharacterized protein LOC129119636 n=1 Tax=Agelaius phoeniceus TaxID=39638 RepID=UPI004054D447
MAAGLCRAVPPFHSPGTSCSRTGSARSPEPPCPTLPCPVLPCPSRSRSAAASPRWALRAARPRPAPAPRRARLPLSAPARLGSAQLGPAQLSSARSGPAQPRPAPPLSAAGGGGRRAAAAPSREALPGARLPAQPRRRCRRQPGPSPAAASPRLASSRLGSSGAPMPSSEAVPLGLGACRRSGALGGMLSLVARLLEWLRSLFWKEEMELTLVGLQYSGKTTLLTVLASGQFTEDMIPTVGFNMRKITKGNVTIKVWDIGGQPRFRSMWERYCRGVNAVVYMVDAADLEKVEASKNELHSLIDKPQLHGIPVLVLGNKRDLPGALDEKQLIEKLNLSAIQDREICCYSISCKEKDNIDITLQWLIQHSKSRNC